MRRLPAFLPAVLALTMSTGAWAAQTARKGPEDFSKEWARIAAAKGNDSARLKQLLDVTWRWQMTDSPEYATVVGFPGQNDRWSDNSLQAIARRKDQAKETQKAVKSIDRANLKPSDRLDYDLFRKGVEEVIEGARFKREYIPITQLGGIQQGAAQILAMAPAATVADYEEILARLEALPQAIDQTLVLLGKGLEAGITPPRITLRDVPDQVGNQIVDDPMKSPLLVPFTRMPDSIAPADAGRLRASAARIYGDKVRPAYEKLRAYLTGTYIPGCRESIGMSELPDGAAWYAYNVKLQTTTDLTPEKIHEIGLSEVKRIHAEMDAVIAEVKFDGSFAEFCKYLRTDKQFFFKDPQMLVMTYRDIAKRADPGLIKLFGRLPRLPYGVVPVPSYAEKSQTTAYYEPGSMQGGRPGLYFVNTYDLKSRPKWEMEALSLHESVPGHHLQIALQEEMEGLPNFRKYGGYTAFVEGWALYSESLGPELGMYQDPYSKFGQLTYEIWRAIRLVVDTGLHAQGWTRQQAIDFFRENSAKTDHDIEVEVDRYIVDPGQALAYKLGELKIKELRAYAAKELGQSFDIRAFHDEVLSQGGLPLDILDARLRAWVAGRKDAAKDLAESRGAGKARAEAKAGAAGAGRGR